MLRELVSIAFLCCPVPAMAADPAEERAKLEGAWTAISAERNGEEAAELVGHRLEFAGRRFHITAQGRILYVGSYAVEPEPQPAQKNVPARFSVFNAQLPGRSVACLRRI